MLRGRPLDGVGSFSPVACQLASPRRDHPTRLRGALHICIMCFLALQHFLLFRRRVFPRALGSVARREPARTPYASLESSRGPWDVLLGVKVARPLGEAFRSPRAIQAHVNPRTENIMNRLKKCPTSPVISGILNVVIVVRYYVVGNGNAFPRHQQPHMRPFMLNSVNLHPSFPK